MVFICVKMSRTGSRKDAFLPMEVTAIEKPGRLCSAQWLKLLDLVVSSVGGKQYISAWDGSGNIVCLPFANVPLLCALWCQLWAGSLESSNNILEEKKNMLNFVARDKIACLLSGSAALTWEVKSRQIWMFPISWKSVTQHSIFYLLPQLLPIFKVTL